MNNATNIIGYELSVSARNDGTLEAAYIRLREAKVDQTREIIEDVLLADYDAAGNLLGIEILAPVHLNDLAELVDEANREPFQRFVRETAPGALVTAA